MTVCFFPFYLVRFGKKAYMQGVNEELHGEWGIISLTSQKAIFCEVLKASSELRLVFQASVCTPNWNTQVFIYQKDLIWNNLSVLKGVKLLWVYKVGV